MPKQKTNKPAKPTYEIGDFSGTGFGLISVRALDRTNPERSSPKPPSPEVYAAQMAYVDVRNAILDDARRRNVIFGLGMLAVTDLMNLAGYVGCSDQEILDKILSTVYERRTVQPLRKPDATDNLQPDTAIPTSPEAADFNRARRASLLADVNRRGIALGLNEAMTDDLEELERIIQTRVNSEHNR